MADRIAGAIVDLAYRAEKNPKIAVEVLIGHGRCHAIIETTAQMNEADICSAVARITGNVETDIVIVPQDAHLSDNQADGVRCGDNGIFKGNAADAAEQKELSQVAHKSMKSIRQMESTFLTASPDHLSEQCRQRRIEKHISGC